MADNKKKITDSLKTKYFKAGSYSILASVIVIAIAVVINILVGSMPVKYTQLDMTSNSLYSISDETKMIIGGLTEDVEVYWIVRTGFEDPVVENLLNNYNDLSEHLKLIKKDPDINPGFVQEYAQNYTDNSILVKKGDRYRFIDGNDLYTFDEEDMYYYYYYGQEPTPTGFDGESQITAAVDFCNKDVLPKMYALTGHGEVTVADSFKDSISKQNIDFEEISLITMEAVPEDADIILIDSPLSDISENEKDMLTEYMNNGGNIILLTDVVQNGEKLTNLESLIASYGIYLKTGFVCDGDSSHYAFGTPYYLLPELASHDITSVIADNGYYVLLALAQGIGIDETLPEGVTVTPLLTSSVHGYIKNPEALTLEYEDGDETGAITLAVAVTNDLQSSKMMVIGTSTILDESANQMVSGGNEDFFLNTIEWMSAGENGMGDYTIHAKALESEYLTVSEKAGGLLKIVMIGLIPVLFLALGIVITVKRRRR